MNEAYFDWLKDQVEYFDGAKHDALLQLLHGIEYVPVIKKDEDRAIDGINLRDKFFEECGNGGQIIDGPCSFLEFLIALAHRMNFIYAKLDEDRTADCFWTMLQNIGIYVNEIDAYKPDYVHDAVHRVIYREYDESGGRNLFPINEPRTNQRNVEVWYQMNQYLAEVMKGEGRL